MGLLPRGGSGNGGGTMEHEELSGRRGIGADGKAWHLSTELYENLVNMQYYRGLFPTADDLRDARPADIMGAYAIVLDTETVWFWADAADGWTDTGKAITQIAGLPPGGAAGQILGKNSDADNDVAWIDQTGGGVVSGRHNDLMSIQGGNALERFHLDESQHDLVDDIKNARPLKPTNISPVDGAMDTGETGPFESSPYANPYGGSMYGYQLVIMNQGNGVVVYDSGNVETTSTVFVPPEGILNPASNYTWQVRYQAGNLQWSQWSEPTIFRTVSIFSRQIHTPALLIPIKGGVLSSPYATLVTTPFSATSGLIQAEGDFEVSATADFSSLVDSGTGMNMFMGSQQLTRGVPYYARARHKAATGEVSLYTTPHEFSVRENYKGQRIGLVLIDEGNVIFQRVDGNYLPIDVNGDYWMTNPIWSIWESSLNRDSDGVPTYTDIDGQKMVQIPLIWIKSGRVPDGPYAGKRFWMIDPTTPTSAEQHDGWHIHAAFINPNGGHQDLLSVSAYLLSQTSNVAQSVRVSPIEARPHEHWDPWIAARNTDISNILKRGWYPMPYYVYELYKLLALLEYGSTKAFFDGVSRNPAKTRLYSAEGYRGIKLWQRGETNTATRSPRWLSGLYNNRVAIPGMGNVVNLPEELYIARPKGTANATGYRYMDKFASSEDGYPDILRFDDYLIPIPNRTDTEINSYGPGSLSHEGSWASAPGNSLCNYLLGLGGGFNANLWFGTDQNPTQGQYDIPRGVLGWSINENNWISATSDTGCMMVKYD